MKVRIGISLLVCGAFIMACNKTKTENKEEKKENKTSLNPNGDSELAIVMRLMMDHGKDLKKQIESSTPITPYPEKIKTITTATPTDGMIEDRDVFNGFAGFYLSTLDSVYLKNVDVKTQFNHMVTSCVNCHENYCHGPIPAIKTLYIAEK